MLNQNSGFIILIIVLGLIAIIFIRRKFKTIKMPNVFLVTGAVKTGKTLLSVHLAIKEYRKELIRYYIRKTIFSMFFIKNDLEKPMLYSNIPLAKVRYNLLTIDMILCNVRIPYRSIVLLDEASLLADSMAFKDKYINNRLMRWVKLFAHITKGGRLIITTQAVCDLHMSFKRCLNNYLYIYSRVKLPFITIMKVREMLYSEDNSMVNNSSEDIELSMRTIFFFNSAYKKYDCYSYSTFTDYKTIYVDYDKLPKGYKDDLKVYQIVSFHDFAKTMNEENKKYYPLDENGERIYEDEEE